MNQAFTHAGKTNTPWSGAMREVGKRIGGTAHIFPMLRLWKLMGQVTPSKATIAV